MEYILNSREMQTYDTNTSEYFKVPSIVLMERASVAFVEELYRQQADLSHVLVVCGNGNNGGDGLAAARLLFLAGYQVDIVMPQRGKNVSPQNIMQQEILAAYGCEILARIPNGTVYTAVIDAIFGVGLSRNIEGVYADVILQMNALSGKKIALDIASGISSDNGAILGTAFCADMTITFAYKKLGMILWPGNEYSGKIIVKDIGINEKSFLGNPPEAAALEDIDLKRLPARKSHSNKGTYGKLLVVAGSVNMAGAACLCAKAAYATGCGLVRVVTPEENRIIIQTAVPEAILTTYQTKEPDWGILKEALDWADSVVLGPGLGTSDTSRKLVEYFWNEADVPLLLDADALNIAAETFFHSGQGSDIFHTGQQDSFYQTKRVECIVTPHLGEMSRLTKKSTAYLQKHLIQAAREFSMQHGVICVLKDEHTITAIPKRQAAFSHSDEPGQPCGDCDIHAPDLSGKPCEVFKNTDLHDPDMMTPIPIYINNSGNSGMATAGSGDVLSGIIGSLLVQGMTSAEAAPYGVFLHGRAGDFMIEKTGEHGLTASDLIEGIKELWKQIA